jgi:hypothetical protein
VSDVLRASDFRPTARRHRRIAALAGCACALMLVLVALLVPAGRPEPTAAPPLDPAARRATTVAPNVVVYSVPASHHSGSHGKKSGSGDSGDSGGSGHSGRSKHSDKSDGSGDSGGSGGSGGSGDGGSGDGGSSGSSGSGDSGGSGGSSGSGDAGGTGGSGGGSPGGTGGSAGTGGLGSAAGSGGSDATGVLLRIVQCPAGQSGVVCLQAVTGDGVAAGLPPNANLPDLPVVSGNGGARTYAGTLSGGLRDKDLLSGGASKIPTGQPKTITLRTTGYSFQDNTPPNSNTISCPIIHKVASGTGTYDDPISVAVPGHAGQGVETPCGTRIYYKDFRFYGIVEDTGATKFDTPHTDIYVDGRGFSKSQSDKCMDPVTKDSVSAIINPPPNLPVRTPGPITEGGSCNVGGGSTGS